jgi:hypothetical protein
VKAKIKSMIHPPRKREETHDGIPRIYSTITTND